VIVVRLRERIRAFEERTGQKMTYAMLAERAGVARATIESLASRPAYNATLDTIDKLCCALECSLLELVHHEPTRKTPVAPTGKSKRATRRSSGRQ
jgi:putative transcriptional regulator